MLLFFLTNFHLRIYGYFFSPAKIIIIKFLLKIKHKAKNHNRLFFVLNPRFVCREYSKLKWWCIGDSTLLRYLSYEAIQKKMFQLWNIIFGNVWRRKVKFFLFLTILERNWKKIHFLNRNEIRPRFYKIYWKKTRKFYRKKTKE